MLKGIDIDQRIKFTSKFDTSEPKTEFTLKPLSGVDMINSKEENPVLGLLGSSILEIKNFDGKKDKEEIIKSLPTNVFNELMEEINNINNITDDDKKN